MKKAVYEIDIPLFDLEEQRIIEKPTKDVYRKEILFINKEDISSIVYSKSSELKYAEIIVNYQSESQSFFFNSKRKAIEYIEALSNWRWNILTSP